MKDWLLKKDNYIPPKDKDKFIDKSIFSILHLLSLIKRNNRSENSLLYSLNPIVKLFFTILCIIFLSLSKSFYYVLLVDVYFLLILSLLDIGEIKKILIVSAAVPMFTVVMLIPSMVMGNVRNSVLLILKIAGTIISINTLSYTTKWHDMIRALKKFFIPDIFILVFDITLRYIFILGEFALDMFYSLKLRSVGKNNHKYSSISKLMGGLFLKSKEMGDEMYSAMECRGFTGEYRIYRKLRLTAADWIYIALHAGIFLLFLALL